MKDWFNNLDEREKVFVIAGTVLVFVAVIMPLFGHQLTRATRHS